MVKGIQNMQTELKQIGFILLFLTLFLNSGTDGLLVGWGPLHGFDSTLGHLQRHVHALNDEPFE
jgi:hypothetical protein